MLLSATLFIKKYLNNLKNPKIYFKYYIYKIKSYKREETLCQKYQEETF